MKTKKFTFAFAVIAALSMTFVACSPNSVAEEDSLYIDQQGIHKSRIEMPSNG